MSNLFSRTELLLGSEAMGRLASSRVAVFGIGGVGGHVVEALVRSGIGAIDVIDDDVVCASNINRQVIATTRTVGLPKVDVMRERILSINPDCRVRCHRCFYLPQTAAGFDLACYDYVVDAVDTVSAKLFLIAQAKATGTPIISAMGAGNKLDPTALRVADIYQTSIDPLAKIMRKELRKRGVDSLKVVYSTEPAMTPLGVAADEPVVTPAAETGNVPVSEAAGADACGAEGDATRAITRESLPRPAREKVTPGSVAFVPAAMGLVIASEVVRDLVMR